MNPLPQDLSISDIYQWLGEGWFLFRHDGQFIVSSLEEEMTLRTITGVRHDLIRDRTYPLWPICGSLNLSEFGYAIYLERIQRRQYRRTYNHKCLSLTIPRKWEVMKAKSLEVDQIHPNTPVVIKEAFDPTYYTYTEALGLMDHEGWTSVALNPYIIVSGGPEKCHVYYRRKLVGTITNGQLVPIGDQSARIKRIIKFFEGRVRL